MICAATAALALWTAGAMAADAGTVFRGQPRGSKVVIEGDSTVHKWTMEGPVIGGTFEVPAGVELDMAQATVAGLKEGKLDAKSTASIPVRTLKSGHDIMDKLYQEALKEPQFPKIVYRLSEMKLKEGHVAGKPFEFDTKGELSFAGKTNTVSFPVKMETTGKTAIKITGNYPFKMTTFGVTPPAPNIGMGAMKVADDVNIVFEWALAVPEKK